MGKGGRGGVCGEVGGGGDLDAGLAGEALHICHKRIKGLGGREQLPLPALVHPQEPAEIARL